MLAGYAATCLVSYNPAGGPGLRMAEPAGSTCTPMAPAGSADTAMTWLVRGPPELWRQWPFRRTGRVPCWALPPLQWTMWRSSEEHSAFQAQLKQLVWDTEALGFFR